MRRDGRHRKIHAGFRQMPIPPPQHQGSCRASHPYIVASFAHLASRLPIPDGGDLGFRRQYLELALIKHLGVHEHPFSFSPTASTVFEPSAQISCMIARSSSPRPGEGHVDIAKKLGA